MKLSLCITTYNRPELTIKAFEKVVNDLRIDEIIIVDDHSDQANYVELDNSLWLLGKVNVNILKKVDLFSNDENLGMSRNKMRAITRAKNDWCILLDSDNVIDSSYLDALQGCWDSGEFGIGQIEDMIYCPSGALPNFDYTDWSEEIISPAVVRLMKDDQNLNHLLNTCNYTVHRETYLKNYVYDPSIKAADTIWHTYNHLKNGGNLYVVPGMFYQHMVHNDSGWMKDRRENSKKFQEIKKMIMAL